MLIGGLKKAKRGERLVERALECRPVDGEVVPRVFLRNGECLAVCISARDGKQRHDAVLPAAHDVTVHTSDVANGPMLGTARGPVCYRGAVLPRRIQRTLQAFTTPADAEAETRRQYRQLSPNERVAITVELQRRYYLASDPPRRLQRVLTIVERS